MDKEANFERARSIIDEVVRLAQEKKAEEEQKELTRYEENLIDLSKVYVEPPALFSLPSILNPSKLTPVFTRGSVSCIIGEKKSRKTFLISLLASRFLDEQKDGKVLWLDTEQSEPYVQRAARRIPALLGLDDTDNLNGRIRIYESLRRTKKERFDMLQTLIPRHRPDLVFVDGIADLISDVNSSDESMELLQKLTCLATDTNCSICVAIHANPSRGDNKNSMQKARGHTGSELGNKSEVALYVSLDDKDPTRSNVTCAYARSIKFADFFFTIDDNGLPIWGTIDLEDAPCTMTFNRDIIETILKANGNMPMHHNELAKQYMEAKMGGFGSSLGAAKDNIKKGVDDGWLIKNSQGLYCLPSEAPSSSHQLTIEDDSVKGGWSVSTPADDSMQDNGADPF